MDEKFICHYTKRETALEKILVTKQLLLGQMGKTNDPRETKDWNIPFPYTFGLTGREKEKEQELVTAAISEVKRIMKEEWKVACFTLEHSNSNQPNGNPLEELENYYFNHGYAHPRMWAQYGQNHEGVCLAFDQDRLNENIQQELGKRCKIYQGPVRYDRIHSGIVIPPMPRTLIADIAKHGQTNAARKYLFDYYEWFFLRKHPDWESEAEYRWLIHSEELKPEFVSIKGAIKCVIVGPDFPTVYEPSLRALCKDLQIPAGRIEWEDGMPKVAFDNIYQP